MEGRNMCDKNIINKLNTIQKRYKLNEIHIMDDIGPGGAHHSFEVHNIDNDEIGYIQGIYFQKGPRAEEESIQGVLDTDLLEIVRYRLQGFQKGEFSCRENAIALTHIEEALLWMNKRVEDRAEANILGTYKKLEDE